MAVERLPTTSSGEPTVDVLIRAYNRATFPNPFNGGDASMADLVRGRIVLVRFAPHWSALFQDWGDHYNVNPAGLFAQNVFKAAENLDGDELLSTVATELAENFPQSMFEGEVDVPEITGTAVVTQEVAEPAPLARFLVGFRQELEREGSPPSPIPRGISDSWITFCHVLASLDPNKHAAVLREVDAKYVRRDRWPEPDTGCWEDMEFWSHAMITEIAKIFASHFPRIVVSHLQTPTRQ